MANNRRTSRDGNLYAPYANKRPAGHKKPVGQGSVTVKRTKKYNAADYGGEDAVKPTYASDGVLVPNGIGPTGHTSYKFIDNAMGATGRIRNEVPVKNEGPLRPLNRNKKISAHSSSPRKKSGNKVKP